MDRFEYEIDCEICEQVSWVTLLTDQKPAACCMCGSDAVELTDLTEE